MGGGETCKITDFGMARDVQGEDFYQKRTRVGQIYLYYYHYHNHHYIIIISIIIIIIIIVVVVAVVVNA